MKVPSSTLLLSSSLLLASASTSLAAPTTGASNLEPRKREPQSFPITRRSPSRTDPERLLDWSRSQRTRVRSKFGLDRSSRQSSTTATRRDGVEQLINLQYDSTWLADVDVGTPSQSYPVVLDTGSSDFWLDDGYYNPSSSSTFTNSSDAFDLVYGSGHVSGYLGKDTVTLAGTTATGAVLAVATKVSADLVDQSTAGIMGMGFKGLSSSGADPLWQQEDIDTFAFYLERRSASSGGNPQDEEAPGGIFTLGGTNASLFMGNISYNPVIEEQYWMLQLGDISTSGSSVPLGGTSRAAIDTGTTLIGGPDSLIEALYVQIPGSSPIKSSPGYYSVPCSARVNATITFGTKQYTIPDEDFLAGALDSSGTSCMGALFGAGSTSADDLQWIVGDAFLKNLYSVFTVADGQARVGFASLAAGLNGGTDSSTVANVASTSSTTSSNSGVASVRRPAGAMMAVLLGAVAASFVL